MTEENYNYRTSQIMLRNQFPGDGRWNIPIIMAPVLHLYNVFRNRWCGAYWASQGLRVVPTVNWGDAATFDFCFAGIEKGSVVAVSTYMASAHDNRCDQKEWFLAGYREMLRRIEPEKIICYHTPFPEMKGNIVYVDYERSSWRYLNMQQAFSKENLEDFRIGKTYRPESDRIEAYMDVPAFKGGGSAYGGKWRPNPNKPTDSRFIGEPGEIVRTFKDGYWVDTKIGDDGRAVIERHYTNHNKPWAHTNPHDHIITWDNPRQCPVPGSPINYPNGAPEFKQYRMGKKMVDRIIYSIPGEFQFESISDFKNCIRNGGEVEFIWKGTRYGAVRYGQDNKISVYVANRQETERLYDTADEALEYMVGEDRLRDVITKVEVRFRSI